MTTSDTILPEGFALLINEDGAITEVIHDTFDLFSGGSEVDISFVNRLKGDSIEKGYRLLENINNHGVAYDWELHIGKQDHTKLFNISGVKIEKGILLIGSPDPNDIEQFMNGLMKMNNEQINKLRLFMKKDQEGDTKQNDWMLYNDMSELNNELATTKRQLMKKTAELERLNEFKNQMMGMAAHDLRNPLMLIQNFSDFLMDDHKEEDLFTENQYMMIKEIKGTSEYMVQIIEDMLDMSSYESGSINLEKETIDLVQLIEEVVSLSRFSANKKDIVIKTDLPDSSVNKEIDGHKFRQVLDNLLSNAVKYSNSDTEVEVGIKETAEGEGVTIFVKDHGQGIPEDEIDKLFVPFSQISVEATAGEKSTGLGLAIVQNIVEAHGGKIEVDSEVGAGSTFFIKIP
ncbi:sensor histidine kinase [Gracilimonas sp. Q87]|uniref:sensor histidine kinase n=1 Tax=Gracilimonas sp. Q87 TaxID=3384766 RepID=UPI0039843900